MEYDRYPHCRDCRSVSEVACRPRSSGTAQRTTHNACNAGPAATQDRLGSRGETRGVCRWHEATEEGGKTPVIVPVPAGTHCGAVRSGCDVREQVTTSIHLLSAHARKLAPVGGCRHGLTSAKRVQTCYSSVLIRSQVDLGSSTHIHPIARGDTSFREHSPPWGAPIVSPPARRESRAHQGRPCRARHGGPGSPSRGIGVVPVYALSGRRPRKNYSSDL